jgi:uncharacterized membrane protein
MKPFILLIVVFGIALLTIWLGWQQYDVALAARIAMSAMLLFTSLGHFMFTKGMSMMIPDVVPFKTAMVYLTGLFEIAAAIGLLIPATRVLTGWVLIVFFIVMLPANINAAIKHLDYEKGTLTGSGPNYLWFRVPLQLLFIAWIYLSAIHCE